MSLIHRIRAWLGQAPSEPTSAPDDHTETAPVAVIDLDQSRRAWDDGVQFIDVREDHEWAAGHIAGAAHKPVGALEAAPKLDIARDAPVVTYCAAGARAARAAAALTAAGYSNVSALASGYGDWRARDYPVETPGPDEQT